MFPSYTAELAVALEAVREAARLCASVQAGLDPGTLTKGDRSPVTVADFGSQALVCRALGLAFPDDPVIGEEDAGALRAAESAATRNRVLDEIRGLRPGSGEAEMLDWIDRGNATEHNDRYWALDPIDGTKGFLRGDQYAIALALVENGRVVMGVLGCPNLSPSVLASGDLSDLTASADGGSLLYGIPGQGAFVSSSVEEEAGPRAIQVSRREDPALARLCESVEAAHTAHGASARVAGGLGIAVEATRIDSQAKYAAVAAGAAEAYLRLPTKPGYIEKIWDHAAGLAVVEAAGGRVTDIDGQPLDFCHGALLAANRGVVATNGHLHDPVLSAIGQVLNS